MKKLVYGALALAITLGASNRSDASFTVTTATSGVSYSGGPLTVNTLAANTSYAIANGTFTRGTQGGTSYTDAAGTTVYLVNDSRTANTQAIPNEQIFVANSNSSAIDTGSFTFTTMINVTYGGVTGTFNEGLSSITLNLSGGDANYDVSSGGLTPPSQIINGVLFTATNAQATSGDINSLNNGAVSAKIIGNTAVPEPASCAMLALGSIVVGSVMARRRRISL